MLPLIILQDATTVSFIKDLQEYFQQDQICVAVKHSLGFFYDIATMHDIPHKFFVQNATIYVQLEEQSYKFIGTLDALQREHFSSN